MSNGFRLNVVRIVSVALVSMGCMQASYAGIVSTQAAIDAETRAATLSKLEAILIQDAVGQQLQAFGVDADHISQRLQGMTTVELVNLENRIGSEIAGGDALAVIGTVFLVLLILELVGVTDVFKSL